MICIIYQRRAQGSNWAANFFCEKILTWKSTDEKVWDFQKLVIHIHNQFDFFFKDKDKGNQMLL